jgi:hypothetical protein
MFTIGAYTRSGAFYLATVTCGIKSAEYVEGNFRRWGYRTVVASSATTLPSRLETGHG